MASGLQATKRRINSVNSTKKITNAMKLVELQNLKLGRINFLVIMSMQVLYIQL